MSGFDRKRCAGLLLLASCLLATVGYRAMGTVPDREAVLDILLVAGSTGRPVRDVVRERGIRNFDWGRAVDRDLADPEFVREFERRLRSGLGSRSPAALPQAMKNGPEGSRRP